jgi:hypothetical protein
MLERFQVDLPYIETKVGMVLVLVLAVVAVVPAALVLLEVPVVRVMVVMD